MKMSVRYSLVLLMSAFVAVFALFTVQPVLAILAVVVAILSIVARIQDRRTRPVASPPPPSKLWPYVPTVCFLAALGFVLAGVEAQTILRSRGEQHFAPAKHCLYIVPFLAALAFP